MSCHFSTHVLDTSCGQPASGVVISLWRADGALANLENWTLIAKGSTNNDGRAPDLIPMETSLIAGTYRIRFELEAYFKQQQQPVFYPCAEITFNMEANQHYHVPLLLNPFGYSTYRGS